MTARKKAPNKEASFEKDLEALEKIVKKLEAGSTSLDESIALFQKARELGKACEERLKTVEMEVETLMEEADGELTTEAFEPEETLDEDEDE